MSSFTGEVVDSQIIEGKTVMQVRMPAISSTIARRRADGLVSRKGIENTETLTVDEVESGRFPGQKIYLITIQGDR